MSRITQIIAKHRAFNNIMKNVRHQNKKQRGADKSCEDKLQISSILDNITSKYSESGNDGKSLFDKDNDDKKIFRENNHIYFRSSVSTESISKLIDLINEYNREQDELQQTMTCNYIIRKPIYLFITSHGGDLFQGFLAYDYIKNSPTPIYTVAVAYAISAGSIMFMAGHQRFMTKNSYILIHQLRSGGSFSGNTFFEELDNTANSINLMQNIYRIYMENIRFAYTPVPKENIITRDILEEHLSHDLYWSFDTCFKYGFTDGVYTNYSEREKVDQDYLFRGKNRPNSIPQPKLSFTENDFIPSDDFLQQTKVKRSQQKKMEDMIKIFTKDRAPLSIEPDIDLNQHILDEYYQKKDTVDDINNDTKINKKNKKDKKDKKDKKEKKSKRGKKRSRDDKDN
jgi:ATP-dependent protease ClpP protease subunit